MVISIGCLVLNLVFSLWLVGPFKQGGLGVANTMSSVFNVWLLLRMLRRKLKHLDMAGLVPVLSSLLGATVVAGFVAWAAVRLWGRHLGHATLPLKLGEVFVPICVASLAYWVLAWWLRVPQAREVTALLKHRLRPPSSGG